MGRVQSRIQAYIHLIHHLEKENEGSKISKINRDSLCNTGGGKGVDAQQQPHLHDKSNSAIDHNEQSIGTYDSANCLVILFLLADRHIVRFGRSADCRGERRR